MPVQITRIQSVSIQDDDLHLLLYTCWPASRSPVSGVRPRRSYSVTNDKNQPVSKSFVADFSYYTAAPVPGPWLIDGVAE
jgi:hypothetical protein